MQWHSAWPDGNRAPKWGDNLRSERAALLLALIGLWSWYTGCTPENMHAKLHLDRLQEALAATGDH